MNPTSVTSARAAEIVGIGYEGFRSYLKRGLLGRVGMLPGFHAAGSSSTDNPVPRAGWQRFNETDLCLMRIAKMLMDYGFSFASANGVVSQQDLWSRLAHDESPTDRYLMIWPPYGDHVLFGPADMGHFQADLKAASAQGPVTVINLGDVQRYVAEQLNQETA